MNNALQKVDHAALKTNQATIILLNTIAFVLNAPSLVFIVMLVILVGTIIKQPGFGFIYQYILKPLRRIKPDVLFDNPEPHRFAQGLGALFMAGAVIALNWNAPVVGWALVWAVTALAALNLFAGFCVGCFIYYWLGRLHLPGFGKTPPQGSFPGMRPKMKVLE
jgi:hypothetical protein